MTTVNLRIDHLVLDGTGLETRDGPRLRAAIEAELTRLLGEGAWGGHRLLQVVRAEPLAPAAPHPESLGAQIGAAIHASLPR